MFQEYYPIRLRSLEGVNHIVNPSHLSQPGNLRSPAMDVMTDFEQVSPVQINDGASLDDANEYMKSQHVRLLFATDADGQLSGIISAADIAGDKPLSTMEQSGISRDEIQVRHIMLKRIHIQALTYEQIKGAKIGDVMLTLKGSGDQHVLIIDESLAGVKRVRGIISASDISRYLRIGFDVMYQAKSFADIERVVSHGQEF